MEPEVGEQRGYLEETGESEKEGEREREEPREEEDDGQGVEGHREEVQEREWSGKRGY